MDKYKIDSHKLIYHVPRVNDWMEGKNVYPIYMEISPIGMCNHRCTFCALDFMEYQKRELSIELLRERLKEMGRLGIKSIMYAGEGEPFLHKYIAEIVSKTKDSGIDVAITSNGALMKADLAERVLPHLEWIKISINAGTDTTYANIHRTKSSDFNKVIKNVSHAVEIKQKKKYKCTIGMQMLLLPENSHEVTLLAETARDMGVDYLVIKPYSQHLMSNSNQYEDIHYESYLDLAESIKAFNTETFSVVFRANTMKKWDVADRNYDKCQALPFWSYIDSGGGVWGCSAFLGDERFLYGNINENSFESIWKSEKRKASLKSVENSLDVRNCRINCRMDEINRYLWELKHPPGHVNFI